MVCWRMRLHPAENAQIITAVAHYAVNVFLEERDGLPSVQLDLVVLALSAGGVFHLTHQLLHCSTNPVSGGDMPCADEGRSSVCLHMPDAS